MNITKRLYSETNIQNIADAIREKTGSNEIYQVRDMPQAILDIPTASGGLDLTTSLVLSSDKSSTTGPVTLSATLRADYDDLTPSDVDLHGYLQGATVTFYDSQGVSLGSGITNSLGVVTCDVVLTETTTIYCGFLGTSDYQACNSNSVSIEVVGYLVYDDFTTPTNNWLTQGGTITRANGELTYNYNGGDGKHNCCYYDKYLTGNYRITAELSNGNYDIIALGINPNNQYQRLGIQPKWDYSLITGANQTNSTRIYINYNYPVKLTIERIGTTIKLYINDELKTTFNWTLSSLDGYVGFDQCNNRSTTCTLFKVEAL